jgi:hypothetical protein
LRDADLIQVDMNGLSPLNITETATSFFFTREFRIKPIGQWQPKKTPWQMQGFLIE